MLGMLLEFMIMILFIVFASILAISIPYLIFVAISLILETICDIIDFISGKGRR